MDLVFTLQLQVAMKDSGGKTRKSKVFRLQKMESIRDITSSIEGRDKESSTNTQETLT